MKLLIYEWNSYLQHDLIDICKKSGIEIDVFSWKFVDKNRDEKFGDWFSENISLDKYDALLSINYFPLLSEVSKKQNKIYIAWCYDNPLNVIEIEKTLGNANNYVVFFDRVQAMQYQNQGFDTVHYAPLGVNVDRLSKLKVSPQEQGKYSCDVSFVGSLYESKINEILAVTDEYAKGYIQALMNVQQKIYGYYMFDQLITDDFVAEINRKIKKEHPDTKFVLLKEALTFAMASEVTRKDRLILLSLLGRRFDTRLYSFQSSEVLKGVKVHPPIDYVQEMPKVFASSKINLNPTLRCIQSGIPLRCFDIMGVGGFLLSTYQPELVEYFVPGEEMVVYESIEDAVEKAQFYLGHDNVRRKIAENGRKKVVEQFSLQKTLEQILETIQ